ncbi:hypothetical protein KPL74_07045 [Bacillus sp. NP157]|nr:hypothetical protein KPL74_07045 [Bacillus sp. NP157]
MTSVQGIVFKVRPSPALLRLLYLVVAAGALSPWPTSLPWAGRLLVSLAAVAVGLWRIRVFRRSPLAAVQWTSEGAWLAIDRRGTTVVAEPRDARVVGEWVVLRLFWQGRVTSLALGPDNMQAETLRVLRVRLGPA